MHDVRVPDILTVHLVATSAYAGFQWTVRVVAYPLLALVRAEGFARYLDAYQRRVTYLVGPLFVALALTSAGLARDREVVFVGRFASVVLFAVILSVTAWGAVPQHRRLNRGWSSDAHRRLLRADTLRVAAATANAALAVLLVSL